MSEADQRFWQSHSMKFLEMAFRTDRQEALQHADGHGKKTGDCGDTVEFFLMVKDNRIETAAYAFNGCLHTNACANTIVELIEDKPVESAWEINPEDVADYLETLPPDHHHCAELAVGALYLALADLRDKKRSPWKKMYK
jgi:nitrogen fixation NifU-like protein